MILFCFIDVLVSDTQFCHNSLQISLRNAETPFGFSPTALRSVQLGKVKVKCTLVQALRLCTGLMAHRGRRGIALLFLDHGTRRGERVSVTPRPLFTSGKDPVPIGRAPGPVLTGAENLTLTGIRPPDRSAP